jgi:hypothetical protein
MSRADIEAALAKAIDDERAAGGIWWPPGTEMAPVVCRRWFSFARRTHSKHPSRDEHVRDLAKGIEAAFNPTGLYLPPGDSLILAKSLADIIESLID